jgi:hypothetical protein
MKPSELYSRKPDYVSTDLNHFRVGYSNHIPEVDDITYGWFDDSVCQRNDQIEFRIHKNFDFDGRRFWKLVSVWFDGQPVMILQNAGREGDDHVDRYITAPELYREMVSYVQSLLPVEVKNVNDVVEEDEEIENLADFYGNSLDGEFERYHY